MPELTGRTAVVTGAAHGLGRATAELLAERGARVVVVDVEADAGATVADAIGGVFLPASAGDPATWRELASHEPTLAVLNAGVAPHTPNGLTDIADVDYEKVKAVNIDQTVYAIRELAPVMRRLDGGSILAVASLAGVIPLGHPIYALTKHAVVGYVRTLAPHLAVDRIRLNSYCPGVMDTRLSGWVEPMRAEGRGAEVITPQQAAAVVVETLLGPDTGRTVVHLRGDRPAFDEAPPAIEFVIPGTARAEAHRPG